MLVDVTAEQSIGLELQAAPPAMLQDIEGGVQHLLRIARSG